MITTTGSHIVGTLDGHGSANKSYKDDGRIGKFELREAGIGDDMINRVLRQYGNGDGFLNSDEFQALLDQQIITFSEGPEGGSISVTPDGASTVSKFTTYDSDGNGVVTKVEFLMGATAANTGTDFPGMDTDASQDFYARIYDNVLDTDGDQKVTITEYVEFSALDPATQVFQAYDTEGAANGGPDGQWNATELAQAYGDLDVTKTDEILAEILILKDFDGIDGSKKDGLVSQAEFEMFQSS